jgi:hypothetical protein
MELEPEVLHWMLLVPEPDGCTVVTYVYTFWYSVVVDSVKEPPTGAT